jgi:putative DNA primase/helicase
MILSRPVPADHAKTLLKLSEEAQAAWIAYHDTIEAELREGGDLRDIRDIASKSADNAARIAALFHVFEGKVGAIDAQTMHNATQLAGWHLNESLRFFGQMSQPKNMSDAAKVEAWSISYLRGMDTDRISTRDIQQRGPVREKASLDDALKELEDLGRARLAREGKKRFVQFRAEVLRGAE